MPQLSLYLDDESMEQLRHSAKQANMSLSRYARMILKDGHISSWPSDFFELFGSIKDETFKVPEELPWDDRVPTL